MSASPALLLTAPRIKKIAKSVMERVAPQLLYACQIHRLRRQEPEIRLLPQLCRKNAISLDIGANLGLYCHHMLAHSAEVVAFEPLTEMQLRLTKQFGSRIALFPVALSDHEGECEIRLPRGNTSWATVEPKNTLSLAGAAEILRYKVPVRRLDDYRFENVGVVKIDVEGHEEAVLRGGLQTIINEMPALIVEIEDRHNPGAVGRIAALLSGLGYGGYFLEKRTMHSIEQFSSRHHQPIGNVGTQGKIGRYINNFIFLPRTRPYLK